MQTFLYAHGSEPRQVMWESLYYLDRQRLGKQRVEAMQLLNAIDNPDHGWRSHPACKMWMPYRAALVEYYNLSLQAWAKRGYKNDKLEPLPVNGPVLYPPFITEGVLRQSHRVCLMLKNEHYYGRLHFLTEEDREVYSTARSWYIDGDPTVPKTTAEACKRTYHWPSAETGYQ